MLIVIKTLVGGFSCMPFTVVLIQRLRSFKEKCLLKDLALLSLLKYHMTQNFRQIKLLPSIEK